MHNCTNYYKANEKNIIWDWGGIPSINDTETIGRAGYLYTSTRITIEDMDATLVSEVHISRPSSIFSLYSISIIKFNSFKSYKID